MKKALVTLKNLRTEIGKNIICRNLSRIMDIKILDIDLDNGKMHFLYVDRRSLEKVINELQRIGYPIEKGLPKFWWKEASKVAYDPFLSYSQLKGLS